MSYAPAPWRRKKRAHEAGITRSRSPAPRKASAARSTTGALPSPSSSPHSRPSDALLGTTWTLPAPSTRCATSRAAPTWLVQLLLPSNLGIAVSFSLCCGARCGHLLPRKRYCNALPAAKSRCSGPATTDVVELWLRNSSGCEGLGARRFCGHVSLGGAEDVFLLRLDLGEFVSVQWV